ncbi:MAG TPA: SRPBCC family protein [Jiangellaceae bacterium]
MNIDAIATAELVTREIRNGERDGAPTKIAVARRTYPTDQADLWDALTNRERLPRWFLPVSGDLEVGGRYQLEGNAGGVVERCEEPKSFAVTWEFGDMMSWLEVSLYPAEKGTLLELAHEAHVDPEMWEQFGPGAVGLGWDLALMGLGLHLESGAPVDKDEALAFPVSPDGVTFVRRAAAVWADAAVAAGDERGQADAAAERAVGFYTTPPEDASGE